MTAEREDIRTKTGKVLSEADIEALVAEAEVGYATIPSDAQTLTYRVQDHIAADPEGLGLQDCPDGHHVWFGSFGHATCAICLATYPPYEDDR